MLTIAEYFWRLLPGNPILLRVVAAASKKRRDLFVRCGYLGLLIAMVVWSIASSGTDYSSGDISALAKVSANLFQQMAYLQLGLVALLSPIFTAGAITQEKDSQTYDILLATPLTNGQIVLGSLMSRVFFIIALLISGIPIFAVTQIFGGVAIYKIVDSFLISATTALLTGALAMAIATFKIGTRRTIFSFYVFIAIYLIGLYLLDTVSFFHLTCHDPQGTPYPSQTSWLTGIHPFLALRVIFDTKAYVPPALADLPANLRYWPVSWMLTSPISFYCTATFLLSLAMIAPAVLLLRWVAQTTSTFRGWLLLKLRLSRGHTRKPRIVWSNPIAWREACTRASVARSSVIRYGFMAGGLVGAIMLLIMYSSDGVAAAYIDRGFDTARNSLYIQHADGQPNQELAVSLNCDIKIETDQIDPDTGRLKLLNATRDDLNGKYEVKDLQCADPQSTGAISALTLRTYPRVLSASQARGWLLGLTAVEFAVILLIISNAAASAVTREKEDGTLDLLLSTPITSRYYIWGKLYGLVSLVLPLILIPVFSAALFIAHDTLRWALGDDTPWIVFPEALLLMPATLVIVCAIAAIVGMQMSLRCRTTVRAVMSSVAICLGVCMALGWCGYQILGGGMDSNLAVAIASFSPFTLLALLIDPYDYAGRVFSSSTNDMTTLRVLYSVVAVVAVWLYVMGVYSMYKAMVKNFDMTIRKQSR